MVKGVNKKIIEINHPDSLYFERAVFYLKPGITQLPQELARADADALTRRAAGCHPAKPEAESPKASYIWLRTVFLMLLSAAAAAAACMLLR